MEKNEFVCETIEGAAPSEDGRFVKLTAATAHEQRHLILPEIEVSKAVISLLVAGGEARKHSGNRNWRDLPLEKITIAAPKDGSDDYRLLLRTAPDADPIVFRIERSRLVAMAEGILQSEGARSSGQTSSMQ